METSSLFFNEMLNLCGARVIEEGGDTLNDQPEWAARLITMSPNTTEACILSGDRNHEGRWTRWKWLLHALSVGGNQMEYALLKDCWELFMQDTNALKKSGEFTILLGIEKQQTTEDEINEAIEQDLTLLLLIKLIVLLAGDTRNTEQQRYLQGQLKWGEINTRGANLLAYWFPILINSLIGQKEVNVELIHTAFTKTMNDADLELSQARRITLAHAELLASQFEPSLSDKEASDFITRTSEVIELSPPTLGLLEIASAAHLSRGIDRINIISKLLSGSEYASQSKKDKIVSGAKDLATALAYDPFNETASANMQALSEMHEKFRAQIPDGTSAEQLTPTGLIVWESLESANKVIRNFDQSDHAERVSDLRALAMHAEFCERLELDPALNPPDAKTAEQFAELLYELASSESGSESASELTQTLKDQAKDREIKLKPTAWDSIHDALNKVPILDPSIFTMVLPSKTPDVQKEVREQRQLLFKELEVRRAEAAVPTVTRAALTKRWFRSNEGKKWKVLAFTGILVSIITGAFHMNRVFDTRSLTRTYHAVVNAVNEQNNLVVLEQSVAFLDQAPKNDPRRSQVAEFLDYALVRETFKLNQNGEYSAAVALIDKFDTSSRSLE